MILDSHVHIKEGPVEPERFLRELKACGVDGAVMTSLRPKCFKAIGNVAPPRERLAHLLEWTKGAPTLFPFYYMDPTERDAVKQVKTAAKAGVRGFKIICNHFYPGDRRAMPTYRAIAETGRPILFHSGILWDGTPSSKYQRPSEWEAMLDVPRLKFALAHISWPWVDECVAVYGKFESALRKRPELSCEMFIDLTPGTPRIYREDALRKIFTVGYKVADNVLFGTDGTSKWYPPDWAPYWIRRDNEIYDAIGLATDVREKVFSGNLKRFLGIEDAPPGAKAPRADDR